MRQEPTHAIQPTARATVRSPPIMRNTRNFDGPVLHVAMRYIDVQCGAAWR
jgi:hypothetical protein